MARRKQKIPARIGKAVTKARGAESLRSYKKKLGVSTSHLWQVENGKTRPGIDQLATWCNITGIPADVFYPELKGIQQYIS